MSPVVEVSAQTVLGLDLEREERVEGQGETARFAIEQMIIIAQFAQPAPHGIFAEGLHAISEVILEPSVSDAFARAAILLQEVSFEVL